VICKSQFSDSFDSFTLLRSRPYLFHFVVVARLNFLHRKLHTVRVRNFTEIDL